MATYFLHVKTFGRGKGSKVTKAAAYRAGVRIRDERTSAVYDYSDRTDVAHAQIVLPTACIGRVEMAWALDRATLWNAAEHAGRRCNAHLAREVLVSLPPELTPHQRTSLVRRFSQELADRYGGAVDFAVHRPRAQADPRNHHAHVLMTIRQVSPNGLGARISLELSGRVRHALRLGPSKNELLWTRERWAVMTNEALHAAGVAQRIDHRSYQDQFIDREPQPRIPESIRYPEHVSGRSTRAGDDIRARYRERVEARLQGPEALADVVKRQKAENQQRAIQKAARDKLEHKTPNGALTREQLNEKRRAWRKANAQEFNRKERERRRANAEDVNRKRREYYRKHRAEQEAGQRSNRIPEQRPERAKVPAPTPPAQNTAAPHPARVAVSAEQSVKNWLAYRQTHPEVTAEKSVENWLAYRERQAQAAAAQSASHVSAVETGAVDSAPRDEEARKRSLKRRRTHDVSL